MMCRKIRAILREKQGLSMILVLCIGALFTALSAALVYAASVLTANANRQLLEQEAYQLATSFSDVLEEELNRSNSDFAQFINHTYMTSAAYGEKPYEQESRPRTFTLNPDGALDTDGADTITVTLVRRPGEDVDKLNLTTNADGSAGQSVTTANGYDWQGQLNTWERETDPFMFTDMQMDVTVTVTKSGESFSYTVTYDRKIHFPVDHYRLSGESGDYHWNGTNGFTITGGKTITINDGDVYTITPYFNTTLTPEVEATIHYQRGAKQSTEKKES